MNVNPLRKFQNDLQDDYKVTLKNNRLVAISSVLKKYSSIQLIEGEIPPLELAQTYFHWLSVASNKLIKVDATTNQYHLCFSYITRPLLILTLCEYTDEKVVYSVSGGMLAKAKQQGTFTFFRFKGTSIIALEHFQPTLPWWLYLVTQAPVHELVMIKFLEKIQLLPNPYPQ